MVNKAICDKCGRVFYGDDKHNVEFECVRHFTGCSRAMIHKIMQTILAPLGIVAIAAALVGMLLYLMLAPLAYPFIYSMTALLGDGEVVSWKEYLKSVYDYPGKVYSKRERG